MPPSFLKCSASNFCWASMPGDPLGLGPMAHNCFRYSYACWPLKGMSCNRSAETAADAVSLEPNLMYNNSPARIAKARTITAIRNNAWVDSFLVLAAGGHDIIIDCSSIASFSRFVADVIRYGPACFSKVRPIGEALFRAILGIKKYSMVQTES